MNQIVVDSSQKMDDQELYFILDRTINEWNHIECRILEYSSNLRGKKFEERIRDTQDGIVRIWLPKEKSRSSIVPTDHVNHEMTEKNNFKVSLS